MRLHRLSTTALLSIVVACFTYVEARPDGAPACTGGASSIGDYHLDFGPGSTSGRIGSFGNLSDGATVLTIDGSTVVPDTTATLPTGVDLEWSVEAFQVAYRGILIRVQSMDEANTFTMTVNTTDVVQSTVCDAEEGNVIGFTHNSNVDRNLVAGIMRFDGTGDVMIDVNVVYFNGRTAPNDISISAYSAFTATVESDAEPPVEAPVVAPVEAPVEPPDTQTTTATVADVYIAFVAPEAQQAPTDEETEQLVQLTEEFYTLTLKELDPRIVQADFTLRETRFEAAIPEERFNILLIFDGVDVVLEDANSTTPLPTEDDVLALLQESTNEVYILDYVRSLVGTPFESTNEVILQPLEDDTNTTTTESPASVPIDVPVDVPVAAPVDTPVPTAVEVPDEGTVPPETQMPGDTTAPTDPGTDAPQDTAAPTVPWTEPPATEGPDEGTESPATEGPVETEAPETEKPSDLTDRSETPVPTPVSSDIEDTPFPTSAEVDEDDEDDACEEDEGKGKGKKKDKKGKKGKGKGKGKKKKKCKKGKGKGKKDKGKGKGGDGKGKGKGDDEGKGKGKKGEGKGKGGDNESKGKKGDGKEKGDSESSDKGKDKKNGKSESSLRTRW